MNEAFVYIKEVAILLVALVGGAATVPVVRWLKDALGTSGKGTIALAVVVSAVLGIAGLIAEGVLTPDTMQPENLSTWGLAIFVASQVIYRQLRDEGVVEHHNEAVR